MPRAALRRPSRAARVAVPQGSFRHALQTEETTEREPGVVDNKFYVRGIGEVVETWITGPVESSSSSVSPTRETRGDGTRECIGPTSWVLAGAPE